MIFFSLFSRRSLLLALPDLTATIMSLTLFQGNAILSLFRDLVLIEPPETGTPEQIQLSDQSIQIDYVQVLRGCLRT